MEEKECQDVKQINKYFLKSIKVFTSAPSLLNIKYKQLKINVFDSLIKYKSNTLKISVRIASEKLFLLQTEFEYTKTLCDTLHEMFIQKSKFYPSQTLNF